MRHLAGSSLRGLFEYRVDGRGSRTRAYERLASATTITATYDKDAVEVEYTAGSWTNAGDYKQSGDFDAKMVVQWTGDEGLLTMGTGPDHGIFDIYIGGSLWQSYDGYSADPGERVISVPPGELEIRNRTAKNLRSSGYIVRFKQLDAVEITYDERTIQYTYDALARLTEADHGTSQFTYGFDLSGNLVNLNGVSRTYDAANRLVHDGTTSLTYDANGNLTNDGTNSYVWDHANRLLAHGGISYKYNGDGIRVQQDALKYILDVQPELALVIGDSDGNRFVHGPRGLHSVYDGGDWAYPVTDGLGSVRGYTDAVGGVLSSVNYSEYGVPSAAWDGPAFTGEWRDANGLQYHRARYYSPQIAVWTALDPWEGLYTRPMSLNGYSWVEGKMPNAADPSGKILETPYLWDICQGVSIAQSNALVHIPCGRQAFVRSHPSTLGRYIGTVFAGEQFTRLSERGDSPTIGLPAGSFVQISRDGVTPIGWVRRTDGSGNINVLDGPAPTSCGTIPQIEPLPRPTFSPGIAGNTRGGTNVAHCFNGTELALEQTPDAFPVPICSQEFVVAFAIACEAGAELYPDGSEVQKQVMADIAHVIRNRMVAGGFPDTAFDVVRQSGQFQCFSEGSGANLGIAMGQIQRTAEALVYRGIDATIPSPSFPEIVLALFTFGMDLDANLRSGAAANSIPRENVATYFTAGGRVQVDQSTLLGRGDIGGIYLGHGPVSTAGPGGRVVFGTAFFSDDPRFTGIY